MPLCHAVPQICLCLCSLICKKVGHTNSSCQLTKLWPAFELHLRTAMNTTFPIMQLDRFFIGTSLSDKHPHISNTTFNTGLLLKLCNLHYKQITIIGVIFSDTAHPELQRTLQRFYRLWYVKSAFTLVNFYTVCVLRKVMASPFTF